MTKSGFIANAVDNVGINATPAGAGLHDPTRSQESTIRSPLSTSVPRQPWPTLRYMPPLDQSLALSIDHGATVTPDWLVVPYPPVGASGAPTSSGTWAVRRAIVRARSALIAMKLDEASKATSQISRLLSRLENSRRDPYAPTLRILDASMHAAADQLVAARAVMMSLPALTTDPIVPALLRYLDWKRGECDESSPPDTVDYLVSPVGGSAIARIFSLCVSAALSFDRLHLTVSSSLASEALQLARERYGNHSAISLLPATLLAQVAYEQGRLEEAEALLRPRSSLIRASGTLECVARASILLARLSLHRGQRRAALAILRETEALGHTRHWPRLASIAAVEYSRISAVIRNEDGGIGETAAPVRTRVATQVSRATLRLDLALRLRRLATCAESPGYNEPHSVSLIETSLRRACVAAADGRFDDSYGVLLQCLRIGATRGLRMIFVDSGRQLVTLLESVYEALATTDTGLAPLRPYIATLLRFTVPIDSDEPEPPTYRALSRREIAILEMIARGMSNKHIAQALGITPETVKSHAKSIFVKLDTRTRAQAVARAESIGLL
jgi:LuxR family transcriptional regulator, maltose regulon positive regulatory protein